MAGRDLAGLLDGSKTVAHPADVPFGYELSGNAVLFKGDWKLVKNLPPYGTGDWELYNIVADPGEVTDMAAAEPARFAEMQADYARFAGANGVLPMPEGYTAPKQIFDNALRNLLIPRLLALWPWALAIVGGIGGLIWWRRRKRQQPVAPV
jgi:arylsulfatase/uncharacterized sulfatase